MTSKSFEQSILTNNNENQNLQSHIKAQREDTTLTRNTFNHIKETIESKTYYDQNQIQQNNSKDNEIIPNPLTRIRGIDEEEQNYDEASEFENDDDYSDSELDIPNKYMDSRAFNEQKLYDDESDSEYEDGEDYDPYQYQHSTSSRPVVIQQQDDDDDDDDDDDNAIYLPSEVNDTFESAKDTNFDQFNSNQTPQTIVQNDDDDEDEQSNYHDDDYINNQITENLQNAELEEGEEPSAVYEEAENGDLTEISVTEDGGDFTELSTTEDGNFTEAQEGSPYTELEETEEEEEEEEEENQEVDEFGSTEDVEVDAAIDDAGEEDNIIDDNQIEDDDDNQIEDDDDNQIEDDDDDQIEDDDGNDDDFDDAEGENEDDGDDYDDYDDGDDYDDYEDDYDDDYDTE